MVKIKRCDITNSDFLCLCKGLDEHLDSVVAEQRMPNANCKKNLEQYKNNCMVAFWDSVPAGCMTFSELKQDESIEIDRVFVRQEFRRHGIAQILFLEAEKIAKKKGAKTIILDTYERLSSAIKFYQKNGFEICEQNQELKLCNSPYSIQMKKVL